jgi:hypothetical protein
MRIIFFVPLSAIALYESNNKAKSWIGYDYLGDDVDHPEARDPQIEGEEGKISIVPFSELVKVFPNTAQVRSSAPLRFMMQLLISLLV